MRKYLLAGLAMAAVFAGPANALGRDVTPPATQTNTAPVGSVELRGEIGLAVRQVETGNYTDAIRHFNVVLADPGFAALPGLQRYGVFLMLAGAESMQGQNKSAFQHLIAAGQAAPEHRDGLFWQLYFLGAWPIQDTEAMRSAALTVATQFPDKLDTLPDHGVAILLQDLRKPDDTPKRRELLKALYKAKYKAHDAIRDPEGLWFQLFELDVAAGDTAEAHVLAAQFHESENVIRLQDDKRYVAYMPNLKPGDFTAMLDAEIARKRAAMTANPSKAEAIMNLAQALMAKGQNDEALSLLDGALAKIDAAPKDKPAFDDDDVQTNWLMDTRVRVLMRMGREQEAEATQIKSRDIAETTDHNLASHAINLADIEVELGQPQKALDALAGASDKDLSPFGLMQREAVRACTAAALKDTKSLAASLRYLRAHNADADGALLNALTCAGNMDDLAAAYLNQLADPQKRSVALMAAQTAIEPAHLTDVNRSLRTFWKQMLARPDVQAAIAQYGTVNSYAFVR